MRPGAAGTTRRYTPILAGVVYMPTGFPRPVPKRDGSGTEVRQKCNREAYNLFGGPSDDASGTPAARTTRPRARQRPRRSEATGPLSTWGTRCG